MNTRGSSGCGLGAAQGGGAPQDEDDTAAYKRGKDVVKALVDAGADVFAQAEVRE